jgi:23S rRNA pseudouridine1911/1915/1917 synthase
MPRFVVPETGGDRPRLDTFLAEAAGCSRAEARRLIEAGRVRVQGRRAHKGLQLEPRDAVELEGEPADTAARAPAPEADLPLTVLHLDDAVVALDKPAGMPTHPLRAGERGTLANALVARHPECAAASRDPREGGLAHRLDTFTSGVILAARTPAAFSALRSAFSDGLVEKEYWALCVGDPPDAGEIDTSLVQVRRRKKGKVRPAAAGAPGARRAETRFTVLARSAGCALVAARSTTGRMHQIRAHLASIGHPLVGDATYGGPETFGGTRQPGHFLHARRIRAPHPAGREPLDVSAPLPADRAGLLAALGIGPLDAV